MPYPYENALRTGLRNLCNIKGLAVITTSQEECCFPLEAKKKILGLTRPCYLKMPVVLQITLLEIFRCAVGVYFVYNCVQCIILPELGELKIALIKIILGV